MADMGNPDNQKTYRMKNKSTSISLLIALIGGPALVTLNTSCAGPANRAQIRQETRVESRVDNRVDHRQERRRGW